MSSIRKSASLTMRVRPDVKAAAERAAAEAHRSVGNLIELLIIQHVEARAAAAPEACQ